MNERQFTSIGKALADARRVEILQFIANQPGVACSGVVEYLDVGQSTVSHHIKILREADLVDYQRDGQLNRLTVRQAVLESYMDEIKRRIFKG